MSVTSVVGIGWEMAIIVIAFLISLVLTKVLIPVLKRLAGQNIREEGPEAHKAKAGTPSMGGIAIVIAVVIASIVAAIVFRLGFVGNVAVILLSFVLFGAIGFFDDYLKVVKKQNEGLKPAQKFGLQFIIALAVAIYVSFFSGHGTSVYIPFYNDYIDFGFWYIPFVIFAILAMVNAVNLTDGLDGLAAGVTLIVGVFFVGVANVFLNCSAWSAMLALVGGCAGFLVFNRHPAKVFMGDTGSLALGGIITAAAIVLHMELFLPIVGLIYLLEVLSVCLQVAYFKATHGKRLFKMTPLHHHFELSGMKETKVVLLFYVITIAMCAIGGLSFLI